MCSRQVALIAPGVWRAGKRANTQYPPPHTRQFHPSSNHLFIRLIFCFVLFCFFSFFFSFPPPTTIPLFFQLVLQTVGCIVTRARVSPTRHLVFFLLFFSLSHTTFEHSCDVTTYLFRCCFLFQFLSTEFFDERQCSLLSAYQNSWNLVFLSTTFLTQISFPFFFVVLQHKNCISKVFNSIEFFKKEKRKKRKQNKIKKLSLLGSAR